MEADKSSLEDLLSFFTFTEGTGILEFLGAEVGLSGEVVTSGVKWRGGEKEEEEGLCEYLLLPEEGEGMLDDLLEEGGEEEEEEGGVLSGLLAFRGGVEEEDLRTFSGESELLRSRLYLLLSTSSSSSCLSVVLVKVPSMMSSSSSSSSSSSCLSPLFLLFLSCASVIRNRISICFLTISSLFLLLSSLSLSSSVCFFRYTTVKISALCDDVIDTS